MVIFNECKSGFAVTCRVLVIVSGIMVSAIGVSAEIGGGLDLVVVVVVDFPHRSLWYRIELKG